MKKLIALLLALVMVIGLAACGNKNETPDNGNNQEQNDTNNNEGNEGNENNEGTNEGEGEQAGTTVESAVGVLEAIWGLYAEDEKFFVMGGDMNNIVDNAPGAYSLEDVETLGVQLLVPAEEVSKITEAASLFHGMMLNNFTCGVFKVAEGVDAAAFAETMHNAVANAQWMCGMPEMELVAVIGGEYVLMCFGINDAVNPFEAKMMEAFPEAEVLYSEAIG